MAVACGGPGPTPATHEVRDSAGIRIVENRAPLWPVGSGWRVAETPALEIGGDTDPDHPLHHVAGVVRLADGRIVVASGGTRELLFYGEDGRLQAITGREGGGPGEFRSMDWIRTLPGDTVLVYDPGLLRLSVFDADGVFRRSALITPPDGAAVAPMALLADRTILTRHSFAFGQGTRPGLHRDTLPLLRFDLVGAFLGSPGRVPDDERFVHTEGSRTIALLHAFGRRTSVVGAGAGYYVGTGDRHEFALHDEEGRLTGLVRRAGEPVPLTDRDVARYRREALASEPDGDDDSRRFWIRVLDGMPYPPTRPAHGLVRIDTQHNLWVESWAWPGTAREEWQVYDAAGRWLGPVSVPAGLEIFDIGPDYVLGVWRDELDVERVRLHRIEKPD
jgi:hypothetical protein